MTTLAELTAYWLAMPSAVPALKGVTVGLDYAMLSQQSASIQYPHLRVDTPAITLIDPENDFRTRFSYTISVLVNVPVQDNARKHSAEHNPEIIKDVYLQVCHDEPEDLFDLILQNASGFDVQRYSGDNDFGWTLKINLELSNKTC